MDQNPYEAPTAYSDELDGRRRDQSRRWRNAIVGAVTAAAIWLLALVSPAIFLAARPEGLLIPNPMGTLVVILISLFASVAIGATLGACVGGTSRPPN